MHWTIVTIKIEIIYTSSRKNDIECVAKDAHGIFWIGFSNQIFSL